jgi:type II secretory pathway pseudopilin PulG
MKQTGQTLVEVIVVITVGIIVIGSLVFATISSTRNTDLAKRQSQATKLAQEAIEKVRTARDRDEAISTSFGSAVAKFSDLYTINTKTSCGTTTPCYFIFSSSGVLTQQTIDISESLNNGFSRQVQITDNGDTAPNYTLEKRVSVLIKWTDFSGDHQSKITTILRKL